MLVSRSGGGERWGSERRGGVREKRRGGQRGDEGCRANEAWVGARRKEKKQCA